MGLVVVTEDILEGEYRALTKIKLIQSVGKIRLKYDLTRKPRKNPPHDNHVVGITG